MLHTPSQHQKTAALVTSTLIALTTLLLPGCNNATPKTKPASATSVVELAESDLVTVQSGEIEQTLPANGTLYAIQETLIRAKVGGDITSVSVREGEAVSQGQELARIDDLEYRARLDDRRAALEAGQAQAALAEATRGRNEELLQKKYLSSLSYDNAKSAAAVAKAQVESLEAHRVLAEKALNDTVIRSPISGWIAERFVQRGDKTSPEGRLFSIVDLSRLELKALVPANEVSRIAIGQAFTARVEGYNNKVFTGHVARIGAQALNGNRAVPLYIEFQNPDAALKAGLFAEGRLTLAHTAARAIVPLTALRSETGSDFVYLADNNLIRRAPVEVGLRNEVSGQAEIIRGIEAGNRIVAVNLGPLKEGATLKIVASQATAKPLPPATTATPASPATEPGR